MNINPNVVNVVKEFIIKHTVCVWLKIKKAPRLWFLD